MEKHEIEALFQRAGLDKIKAQGVWVSACCPFHGEKTPSFKAKSGGDSWYCFGCGKGGKLKYLLVDLGLAKQPDGELALDARVERAMWKEREAALEAHVAPECWPEAALTGANQYHLVWDQYHPYFEDRGVDRGSVTRWGLGYDQKEERILFPLRDRKKRLVGVSGRSWAGSEIKYAHYCYDLRTKRIDPFIRKRQPGEYLESKKSSIVYGGHLLLPHISTVRGAIQKARETLIVVEGHLDAVRLDQMGFWTVAIMGSSVSSQQEREIEAIAWTRDQGSSFDTRPDEQGIHWPAKPAVGPYKVVVMLDGDAAGVRGTEKFLRLARCIPVFKTRCPEGKDPATMSEDEVLKALDEARIIL